MKERSSPSRKSRGDLGRDGYLVEGPMGNVTETRGLIRLFPNGHEPTRSICVCSDVNNRHFLS